MITKPRKKRTPKVNAMHSYRAYNSWRSLKIRILYPSYHAHHLYKKVFIDARWLESFWYFLEDMGERPEGSYSIDRINNTKGYYKENCQWILQAENARKAKTIHGRSRTLEYNREKSKKRYAKYKFGRINDN